MNILQIVNSLKKRYVPSRTVASLYAKRHEFLSECIIPTDTLVFSGKGATLQTNMGELIDLASMTVNCILGQNDPWVNANLIAYMLSDRPSFLTTRLGSDFYVKVAKRIIDVSKMTNAVINHRQCNGTDVTELATLAAFSHRRDSQYLLASFQNSYHGQGLTAYLISGLQMKHRFLIQESPILFLNEPKHTDDISRDVVLSHTEEDSLHQLYELRDKVFAVIIEPIQVNNAVNTPSKNFIKKLKEVCTKGDISLIFDEVQTGFGWLGTMTAAERYGVWPNLLALSKAVTGGNGPLSALVSDKKYQDIKDGTGAKTNGADIRSLVASNAVMDRLIGVPEEQIPSTIEGELYQELKTGLLSRFTKKQLMLIERLKNLQKEMRGFVGRIKGDGLIRGIEILDVHGNYDPITTEKLQADLLNHGVLVRHNKHTLLFKVPIVIKEEELDKGFKIIRKVMNMYRS